MTSGTFSPGPHGLSPVVCFGEGKAHPGAKPPLPVNVKPQKSLFSSLLPFICEFPSPKSRSFPAPAPQLGEIQGSGFCCPFPHPPTPTAPSPDPAW